MHADSILISSHRDPAVVAASFGANLLSLAVPMAMIHIYDRVIPNRGYETLIALGLMVMGAILAEIALRAARRHLLELAADRFECAAYPAAVKALLLADPAREECVSQGHLFRCVTGIERLRNMHVGNAALDPLDLPFALLFLVVIALISPELSLSVFVLLTFAFVVLRLARRRVLAHQIRRKENEERRHSYLSEVLRGMDVVRSLGIEDFMLRRYERLLGSAATVSADTARVVQLAQGFTAAIGTLAPLFVASIGALMVMRGDMSVGSLAATVLLTGRIIQPVLRVEAYLAGSENLRQTRDDLREIAIIPARADGLERLDRIKEIAVTGGAKVTDRSRDAASGTHDLSFRRGDCVAITGADRQTRRRFLHQLAGELPCANGQITLNRRPASDYALADRQRLIKLLSAENALIEGTVLENLTAFRPKLFRDPAIALARDIGIEATIAQSPEGYSVMVGPNARANLPKSLSDAITIVGGLVSDPDVILFDEANGSLDRETDSRLLRILQARRNLAIIFLVSNRPSYLNLATRSLDISSLDLGPCRTAATS